MSTPLVTPVTGLPEGLEFVRLGIPGDEEFEIINTSIEDGNAVPVITQGKRPLSAVCVIVKPAEGYKFRYDIKTLNYLVVKMIPAKTIIATITFKVDNDYDDASLQAMMGHVKSLPGFVSIETS